MEITMTAMPTALPRTPLLAPVFAGWRDTCAFIQLSAVADRVDVGGTAGRIADHKYMTELGPSPCRPPV